MAWLFWYGWPCVYRLSQMLDFNVKKDTSRDLWRDQLQTWVYSQQSEDGATWIHSGAWQKVLQWEGDMQNPLSFSCPLHVRQVGEINICHVELVRLWDASVTILTSFCLALTIRMTWTTSRGKKGLVLAYWFRAYGPFGSTHFQAHCAGGVCEGLKSRCTLKCNPPPQRLASN